MASLLSGAPPITKSHGGRGLPAPIEVWIEHSMYALRDCRETFRGFERWSYIGVKRLQLEYRRALIGSLWIVLGFTVTALGIGILMGSLLGRPLTEHVPYVAFGLAFWNFISGAVIMGCSVFASNRAFVLQSPTPRGAFALILLVRIAALMMVNVLTAAGISAAFGWRPTLAALEAAPALLLLFVTGYGAILVLGLLCARLPDLGELIASVMRLAFFLTPIIWTYDRRATRFESDEGPNLLGVIYMYNPFTYFLNVARGPLLADPPGMTDWVVAGSIGAAACLAGLIALQYLGKRVAFWV